jgi:hypothetical protein
MRFLMLAGLIFVAKLGPDATTNNRHDGLKKCNGTGNPFKSVLAAPI